MLEALKIIGALLGIFAFFWKVRDLFSSYLHIELTVDTDGEDTVSAKAVVENKSPKPKKVDNALLVVGPEAENPIETFNRIAVSAGLELKVSSTNEIAASHFDRSIYDGEGRAVIPLSFFYSENITISDERLAYRAPIDSTTLERGRPYSVRFFISTACRLHRSAHGSFMLKESAG